MPTDAVTDAVNEALRPFHLWAQLAAVCAVALAISALGVLVFARRLSPSWWLGQGLFTLCLLAVAFGARARSAAYDLRPFVVFVVACDKPSLYAACQDLMSMIAATQQLVVQLGILLLVGTALALVATAAVVLLRRRTDIARHLSPYRVAGLALAIFVAGCGAYMTSDGVAAWIRYAYLADLTGAGDGIGMIPFFNAVVGTLMAAIILLVGVFAVITCTVRQPRRPSTGEIAPEG